MLIAKDGIEVGRTLVYYVVQEAAPGDSIGLGVRAGLVEQLDPRQLRVGGSWLHLSDEVSLPTVLKREDGLAHVFALEPTGLVSPGQWARSAR